MNFRSTPVGNVTLGQNENSSSQAYQLCPNTSLRCFGGGHRQSRQASV